MKSNIGETDRIVRVFLGLTIIGIGLSVQNWLGLIGMISLATALIGKCPLYVPFGISTIESRDTSGGAALPGQRKS
ncbi:DUF2892 domain-containing protein [Rhodocytophaga rosea]|uniref:DUF2892 domain-containing protein n=1 Tax=Rhodocytophaga rosea TaxID=2704465 RepID=A0A6C0GML2_9BACT|nr:DUF2892 domain-containing protein [Rhodocytophaga rosea]QHT68863.1 DUF2892 domain-containing protein [Rhodocytophaga rosea]